MALFLGIPDGMKRRIYRYNKEYCSGLKESVVIQLIQFLNQCALTLHYETGMRVINLDNSDITAYRDAFFETLHLTKFLGGELTPLVGLVTDTVSTASSNSQEDIYNMFMLLTKLQRIWLRVVRGYIRWSV